jgi:hypothetical protein
MRTAKELAKIFSDMNPDETVWCIWVDRDELVATINDSEMTDHNDELVTVDKDVITQEFYESVMSRIDGNDSIWDRFNEDLNDVTRDRFVDFLEEQKKLEEEEELEKDLWDKE